MTDDPSQNPNPKRLPEFGSLMEHARRSRSNALSDNASVPSLADDVLRTLRSMPADARENGALADLIRISRWAAAVGCALALLVATFAPKFSTNIDQPNALSLLGGW